MNRLRTCLLTVCAVAAFTSQAFAQVTVTAADVTSDFAVGNIKSNQYDSTVTSLNIGSPGSSSWDFSGLHRSSGVTLTSVAVQGTPFASHFPAATFALQTNVLYQGIPAVAYIYFQLGANLLDLGQGAGVQSGAATVVATNTPSQVLYALPATYGTTWTTSYLDTTIISLDGVPMTGSGVRHVTSFVVDAYGSMTIPGGTVHQTLRIRKVDSTFTTPAGTAAKVVGYIYLAKDGTLVQMNAAGEGAADSGTISIAHPVSWQSAVATSIGVAPSVSLAYSLGQNYPNPFNPSTEIPYSLPGNAHVTLAVFNILGQQVATLVDENQVAGKYTARFDGSSLASGLYFYRLQAGSFLQTRRLLLLR